MHRASAGAACAIAGLACCPTLGWAGVAVAIAAAAGAGRTADPACPRTAGKSACAIALLALWVAAVSFACATDVI